MCLLTYHNTMCCMELPEKNGPGNSWRLWVCCWVLGFVFGWGFVVVFWWQGEGVCCFFFLKKRNKNQNNQTRTNFSFFPQPPRHVSSSHLCRTEYVHPTIREPGCTLKELGCFYNSSFHFYGRRSRSQSGMAFPDRNRHNAAACFILVSAALQPTFHYA